MGKKVLEVGVGAGTDFLQFVGRREGLGIDLTEKRKNSEERLNSTGLKPRNSGLHAEKFLSDNILIFYSWGVIHHAEDMEKVFSGFTVLSK